MFWETILEVVVMILFLTWLVYFYFKGRFLNSTKIIHHSNSLCVSCSNHLQYDKEPVDGAFDLLAL